MGETSGLESQPVRARVQVDVSAEGPLWGLRPHLPTVIAPRRRLFRVPWIAGRSNQSILKEINSEQSLEGLMLKLKLQYFHLM